MRNFHFICVVSLAIILAGCNFPLVVEPNSINPGTANEQMALTLTAISAKNTTPSVQTANPCFYMWASEYLPAESVKLQNALTAAGVQFNSVRAEAYGETCTDSVTYKILSFGVMETDLKISLPISDLNNTESMGDTAFLVLQTILGFPADTFPGPNPGYVGLTFQSPTGDQNLWFQISSVKNSVRRGIKGSDLYNLLLNP